MSKLLVIGGGAAGTAAAHRLQHLGHEVTIIEQQPQLGGRIRTWSYSGVAVEMGASFIASKLYRNTYSIITGKPLEKDLRKRNRMSAVIRDGVEHEPLSILGNSWLSWGAKRVLLRKYLQALRNASKLNISRPWQAATFDISTVPDNYKTAYERELLEYLIQPALDGFFFWSERTSNAMFMLLINSTRQLGKSYTLAHGQQQIPEHLSQSVSQIFLNTSVTNAVRQTNGSYEVHFTKNGKASSVADIEGIVCATTATAVAKIFTQLTVEQINFFRQVQYSSTVVLARCYMRDTLFQDRTIAYPTSENANVAATSSHSMVIQDQQYIEIIKSYASGRVGKELVAASDKAVIAALHNPAQLGDRILDDEQPAEILIQRWPEALPEANIGHFKQLARFHNGEIEVASDKLVFAGDYIGGPFIEGAISSGFQAAERLHANLTK